MSSFTGYFSSSPKEYFFPAQPAGNEKRIVAGNTTISISKNAISEWDLFDDKDITVAVKGDIWHTEDLTSISFSGEIARKYRLEGEKSFASWTGNFALAITDKKKNILFLVSDPLGSVPIFIYNGYEKFVFGTEFETLLHNTSVSSKINRKAFTDFIYFGTTLNTDTLIEGLEMLAPGTTMKISPRGQKVSKSSYNFTGTITINEAADQLASNFQKIVSSYIRRYDQNLIFTLSGGMDSGIVFSAVPEEMKSKISALTIHVPELDPQSDRDVLVAKMISDKFHFNHFVESTNVFSDSFSPTYLETSVKPQRDASILVKGTYGGEFYRLDFERFVDPNLSKSLSAISSPGFFHKFRGNPMKKIFSRNFLKRADGFSSSVSIPENEKRLWLIRYFSSFFFSNIYSGSQGGWLYPYKHQDNSLNLFLHPANIAVLLRTREEELRKDPFLLFHLVLKRLSALNGIPVNSEYGKYENALRPFFNGGEEPKRSRTNHDGRINELAEKFIRDHPDVFAKVFLQTINTQEGKIYRTRLADLENWLSFYKISL